MVLPAGREPLPEKTFLRTDERADLLFFSLLHIYICFHHESHFIKGVDSKSYLKLNI